jgi:hypothetical protein
MNRGTIVDRSACGLKIGPLKTNCLKNGSYAGFPAGTAGFVVTHHQHVSRDVTNTY